MQDEPLIMRRQAERAYIGAGVSLNVLIQLLHAERGVIVFPAHSVVVQLEITYVLPLDDVYIGNR